MKLEDGHSYWLGAYEGDYVADGDYFQIGPYGEPAALSAAQFATDPATHDFVADRMRQFEFAAYIAAYWSESRPDEYHHRDMAIVAGTICRGLLGQIEGQVGPVWG